MRATAARILAAELAAVGVVLADSVLPLGPLRVLAGVAMTLVVPGAAILLASGSLRGWAFVLALPYSLAVAAVGGVFVERIGVGLRPESLVGWSLAVTLLAIAVAVLRSRPATRPALRGDGNGPLARRRPEA